ncbi:MAG: CYTH domain-containing protein [Paludibacteraceae bacterium]|nr:CYTH domain-containing protein [Paludibacteraceae bacterium]
MGKEIERKYLVKGDFKPWIKNSYTIIQGYLCSVPERTVRIRVKNQEKGFITIKGKTEKNGLSRYEWEKEIPLQDAQELLQLCEPGIIEKTRYEVIFKGQRFEIDEFHGENEGLIIAEIELESENTPIQKPDWLGKEVTGEERFYNAQLRKNPYKNWENKDF